MSNNLYPPYRLNLPSNILFYFIFIFIDLFIYSFVCVCFVIAVVFTNIVLNFSAYFNGLGCIRINTDEIYVSNVVFSPRIVATPELVFYVSGFPFSFHLFFFFLF